MSGSNDGYYEVLWPRAPRRMQQRELAPRLDSLEGKTIAQLWDYLFKGDEVFALLEQGIRARCPVKPRPLPSASACRTYRLRWYRDTSVRKARAKSSGTSLKSPSIGSSKT